MALFGGRRTKQEPAGFPARLPRASQITRTEQYARDARESQSADEHWTQTQVFSYLELLHGRSNCPVYVGVIGRPAILLCLSTALRANLDGLDTLIRQKGAQLYLAGHRVGRYGLVRAVLELPEYELIFETLLSLADSDVHEFLIGAYENEAFELHLAHVNDSRRAIHVTYQAAGLRPIVDAALDAVRGLDHPMSAAEKDPPASELESRFPRVSDGLTARTRVRLAATGTPNAIVYVETRN